MAEDRAFLDNFVAFVHEDVDDDDDDDDEEDDDDDDLREQVGEDSDDDDDPVDEDGDEDADNDDVDDDTELSTVVWLLFMLIRLLLLLLLLFVNQLGKLPLSVSIRSWSSVRRHDTGPSTPCVDSSQNLQHFAGGSSESAMTGMVLLRPN